MIDFARYCLPQVFFYGMFVLVGQILNARGRFGPMMWAPIANNVISVAGAGRPTCVVFGPAAGRRAVRRRSPPARSCCSASARRSGIVVQLLILLPYLRAAGFRFRPALRLPRHRPRPHPAARASGRCCSWWSTRSPTPSWSGSPPAAPAAALGGDDGDRLHRLLRAFLIVMVPHSIVTVSLATAVLPRLSAQAADGDLRRLAAHARRHAAHRAGVIVPVRAAAAGGRARRSPT